MISSRIFALCLLSILAGCTSRQPPTVPADPEDLFVRPLVAESVMRDGSRLQFALALPDGDSALVALDCVQEQAELLYLEGVQRVYPGRVNTYAKPLPLSATKIAVLKKRPEIMALCSRSPLADWRTLGTTVGGDGLILDRNSVMDVGGARRFWGGQQLAKQVQTPRYGAPVRQWRESLAADCRARRYVLLARYGLDETGFISDGQSSALVQESFSTAPVERRTLLETACDHREGLLAAQRPITAEAKQPPLLLSGDDLPPVQPQPLEVLKAVPRPAAHLAVRRFVEEGESRYAGRTHPYQEVVLVAGESTPGVLRFSAHGRAARVDALSWRGLIDLVRRTRVDNGDLPVEELATLSRLSLRGDWRMLAVGSQVSYQAQQLLTGNLKESEQRELRLVCTVMSEDEAGTVLASLSGRAKRLECQHGESSNRLTSRWVYLQDYDFFHMTGIGAGGTTGLEKQLTELQ